MNMSFLLLLAVDFLFILLCRIKLSFALSLTGEVGEILIGMIR